MKTYYLVQPGSERTRKLFCRLEDAIDYANYWGVQIRPVCKLNGNYYETKFESKVIF